MGVDPQVRIAELERLVKALTQVIKIEANGAKVEIKATGGASIVLTGPTVNINNGALEVL
jgi:hypothetical protein